MVKTKFFLAALIFIVIVAVSFLLGNIADSPTQRQSQWLGKKFAVATGDNWRELGWRLKKENLIRSLLWYRIQLRLYQTQNSSPVTLKAGSYTWPRFLSTREIIAFFQVAQPQKTYPVTIPEGLTRREVAQILQQNGIVLAADFLRESELTAKYAAKYSLPVTFSPVSQPTEDSVENLAEEFTLEGFLFPDTYFLPQNYSSAKVIELMLQNFSRNLQVIVPDWQNRKPSELYQKLILASIVQKEYRAAAEAPLIASVFQNRLDLGMRLESCATVVYVLTEEFGRPHPKRIMFADLEQKSPYNTYLQRGLPPRPIASVGAVALEAAFYQAQTNYLFFVVKDAAKGTHTFSDSFSDHNAARAAYIKNYFP